MKKSKLILILAISMVFVFILSACKADTGEEALPTAAPTQTPASSEQPSEEPMESEEPETSEEPEASEEPAEERVFTLEELNQYNGENGQPAYVAVDGVVYDFTDSSAWKNGKHNGFTAGQDLTEEIKTISPHGTIKLEGMPIVGKLASD